jgi:hypothetical protein
MYGTHGHHPAQEASSLIEGRRALFKELLDVASDGTGNFLVFSFVATTTPKNYRSMMNGLRRWNRGRHALSTDWAATSLCMSDTELSPSVPARCCPTVRYYASVGFLCWSLRELQGCIVPPGTAA